MNTLLKIPNLEPHERHINENKRRKEVGDTDETEKQNIHADCCLLLNSLKKSQIGERNL